MRWSWSRPGRRPSRRISCWISPGWKRSCRRGVRKPSAASCPAIAALPRPCPASALIRSGQRRVVRQLVDPGHRAPQVGVGLVAAGPGHGGVHALGGALGGDLDGLDDGAQQPLAVGHRGGRRGPQRRDVAGQGTDRGQLAGRQPGRAGPLIPLVLLAQVRPLGQRGFPLALELTGHQTVLRLGQLVLAPRPVAGEVRAFQPLPPDPVHLGPAGLDLPGGGDRQLQRGRGQRRQHLGDDMVIEEPRGHLLAARLPVGVMTALAAVPPGQPLPAGLVAHLQAVTADPAGHQPAQQRGALTRRAQALGAGPVGGQPRQVPLVLLHADVGRQRALDADQPFPGLQRAHPAGMLAAGQPPGPVGAAAPVGVDPA